MHRFQVRFAHNWEYKQTIAALLETNCNVELLDTNTLISTCTLTVLSKYATTLEVDLTVNSDVNSDQVYSEDSVIEVGYPG